MGDIQLIRAYRMDPGYGMGPFPRGENELLWQLSPGHPYQFLWSSGGIFIELMIHQIDECFWIKDSWPVAAHGVGGRFAGSTDCSQNLDSYSIEYTFADGTKALVTGRYIPNCHNDFATFVHGTKCAAKFSGNVHAPTCWICKDQHIDPANIAWKPEKETVNPWQAEWDVLLGAIRNDRPHNEARRAALSNLGAIMGRAAVHTGQGRHLGRGDGLGLPVLPERRQPDRRQPGAGPGQRRRPLPRRSPAPGRKFERASGQVLPRWTENRVGRPFPAVTTARKGRRT